MTPDIFNSYRHVHAPVEDLVDEGEERPELRADAAAVEGQAGQEVQRRLEVLVVVPCSHRQRRGGEGE
jgi:hypothetical protein